MLIIPYTHLKKTMEGGLTVHRIHILCQGGRTPWEEDEQDVQGVLETNGIYMSGVSVDHATHTYYVEIDTARTDMASMYTWQELPYDDEQSLCWRTFTVVRTPNGSQWLPTVQNEPFSSITERILCTVA